MSKGSKPEVINGARQVLKDERLLAVLMELNGAGTRYGYDEKSLLRLLEFKVSRAAPTIRLRGD